MEGLNPRYIQEDYARAVLRSAISTVNRKLQKLIYTELDSASLIRDGYGTYTVNDDYRNNKTYNPYNATIKSLNDEFFYSIKNTASSNIIAQVYTMFGTQGNVFSLLSMESRSNDRLLNIDPILKHILLEYNDEQEKQAKAIVDDIYNSRIPRKEGQEKLKELRKSKIVGKDYHDFLISAGYSERVVEEMEKFIDIANYKNSSCKIIEFMDTYTMYHYYIYRKAVNNRFIDYLREHPGLSIAEKRYVFGKIAREQMSIHCKSDPCPENAFFDRRNMRLVPHKMHIDKAKKLTMELHSTTSAITKMICDKIEHEIKGADNGYNITIREIVIDPEMYKKDNAYFDRKTGSPQIYVNVRSGVKKMVSEGAPTQQSTDTLRKVEVVEDLIPNPNLGKARIVYDSRKDRPRFYSESAKKQREEKERRKAYQSTLNDGGVTQLRIEDFLK